jgi:hypothetical protein
VEPVALRPVLPAPQAPCDVTLLGTRLIPSPDAALGDGNGRSAAITTFLKTSPPSSKSLSQDFEDTPVAGTKRRWRGSLRGRGRKAPWGQARLGVHIV